MNEDRKRHMKAMYEESLDREFWLIILTSFDMSEIDNMSEYAKDVERNLGW